MLWTLICTVSVSRQFCSIIRYTVEFTVEYTLCIEIEVFTFVLQLKDLWL